MRYLLSVLVLIGASTAFVLDDPSRPERFVSWARDESSDILYHREIQIDGLLALNRKVIEELLPSERSNLWWRTNVSTIGRGIQDSPFVKHAEVEPCSSTSIDCYNIHIEERTPGFVAVVQDRSKAWVIGDDGTFIAPLSHDEFRSGALKIYGDKFHSLVVVYGLWGENSSPDEVRERLVRIGLTIKAIAEKVKLPIDEIALDERREATLKINGIPFPIVVDLKDPGFSTISEKAERLAAVLGELRGRFDRVERLDLSLDKMAVLKLRRTLSAGS